MQFILPYNSGIPQGTLARELLTGSTYASRTEGAGYYRNVTGGDLPSGFAQVRILTLVSGTPTGAMTRELLTGSTYAARTEGAGYLRNVWSTYPATVISNASCRAHPLILCEGTTTPTASCRAHPFLASQSPAVDAVGVADCIQGTVIHVYYARASCIQATSIYATGPTAAACLVKGIVSGNGQTTAANSAAADCRAHPLITCITPANWTSPECLDGVIPSTAPVSNFVF